MMVVRFALFALVSLAALQLRAIASVAPQRDGQEAPAKVMVAVVDESGDPIPNASIHLAPSASEVRAAKLGGEAAQTVTAQTNEDGFAGFEFAPGEARSITAYTRDFDAEIPTIEIAPVAAGEIKDITVRIRSSNDATYRARIVDARTGQPIQGVALSTKSQAKGLIISSSRDAAQNDMLRRPDEPAAVSDESGSIHLSVATWRRSKLTLHADGYALRSLYVAGSESAEGLETPATIQLRRECLVQVTLFDPPEHVDVYAEFSALELFEPDLSLTDWGAYDRIRIAAKQIDASETFVVSGVPPNTTMRVKAKHFGKPLAEQRAVGVGDAGSETRVVLDLSSPDSADVRVIGIDGEPIANTEVWYGPALGTIGRPFRPHENPHGTARTDAGGLARIVNLRRGRYRVSLAPDRERLPRANELQARVAATQTFETSGDGTAADVTLRLVQGLFIRGTVVDPDGRAASAYVSARRQSASAAWSSSLQAREVPIGKFELGPLLPGTYSIYAGPSIRAGFASSLSVEAQAGDNDVVIELRPTGSVAGRVFDAVTGTVERNAELILVEAGRDAYRLVSIEPSGAFQIGAAPVGKHHLLARTDDGRISDWIDVEIERGEQVSGVEVRLRRQGVLLLTCDDATGLPSGPISYSVYTEKGRWYRGTTSAGEPARLPLPAGRVRLELDRAGSNQRPVYRFDVIAEEEIAQHVVFEAVAPKAVRTPEDR